MRKIHLPGVLAALLGVWMILAPAIYEWRGDIVFGYVLLGALLVGAGIWRALGLRGGQMAGVTMILIGAATVLMPWIYDGVSRSGRWNAWINGLIVLVLGVIEARRHVGDRPAHGLYFAADFLMHEDPEKRFRQELKHQQRRIREATGEEPPVRVRKGRR